MRSNFRRWKTRALKNQGLSYRVAKASRSWGETTGGSWCRSPKKIICTPPKGRPGSGPHLRRKMSMASTTSARTMEISSMMTVRSLRNRLPPEKRSTVAGKSTWGGKRKKEWMVCPPTCTAATPVGASTTALPRMRERMWRSKVDFPVPALPVTNRQRRPSSSHSTTSWNPSFHSRAESALADRTPPPVEPGASGAGEGMRRDRAISRRRGSGASVAVAQGSRAAFRRLRRARGLGVSSGMRSRSSRGSGEATSPRSRRRTCGFPG